MQVRFICGLSNFKTDFLEQGDTGLANCVLTQGDKAVIEHFINMPSFLAWAGRGNIAKILESVYIYKILDDVPDDYKESHIAHQVTEYLSTFLNFLWLVKDHSCNIQPFFIYITEQNRSTSLITDGIATDSRGDTIDVTFSKSDLEDALKFIDIATDLFSGHKTLSDDKIYSVAPEEGGTFKGSANLIQYNDRNRIERAFKFLTLARQTLFMPFKISLYINVYECLFTSDNIEVNHKIAERCALFMGGSKDEKLSNFKLIKHCYTIRSNYFHGEQLPKGYKDYEKLQDYSYKIDCLTRDLFKKIFNGANQVFLLKDNSEIDIWFNDLLFAELDKPDSQITDQKQ